MTEHEITVLYLMLLLLASACFLTSTFKLEAPARINVLALGLFFWVLVPLISMIRELS